MFVCVWLGCDCTVLMDDLLVLFAISGLLLRGSLTWVWCSCSSSGQVCSGLLVLYSVMLVCWLLECLIRIYLVDTVLW